MTRLFVVRHGNTFEAGEAPRRIGARTDLPLTAAGVAQAKKLGAYFVGRNVVFRMAIASPLARTRQTASIILADQPFPPALASADWLSEIDHGPDENAAEPDVIARIGRTALTEWERNGTAPPGWRVDAPARIAGWRTLMAMPPPEDTLLVTSNGAARFALFAIGAVLPDPVRLDTGAFGIMERTLSDGSRRSHGWAVTAWNERP